MNKPVAWGWYDLEIKRFFPHWDEDLMENKEGCIPLYTHPVKELDRELLDKTIIDQQNEIKDLRKNLDIALMIVNKPELTDEEILEVWRENEKVYPMDRSRLLDRTRACIRKAQEK